MAVVDGTQQIFPKNILSLFDFLNLWPDIYLYIYIYVCVVSIDIRDYYTYIMGYYFYRTGYWDTGNYWDTISIELL